MGWQADIGVKLKFFNSNFWVADIENTDYVGHGTAFNFFQLQKTSFLEPSKVGQFCTFLYFHYKKANIWHQNLKFEGLPEIDFYKTLVIAFLKYILVFKKVSWKLLLGHIFKFYILIKYFGHFSSKLSKGVNLTNFRRL